MIDENKYTQTTKIMCRVTLLTQQKDVPRLSEIELQTIKDRYAFTEWMYYIAKKQYELGYLNEFETSYI